jgi:hypothetical protein
MPNLSVSSSIMLEYMLAYQLDGLPMPGLSKLLAADLDDDARQFYLLMSSDITEVAAAAGRPTPPAAVVQTLLSALVVAPEAKSAYWRRLYRQVGVLMARDDRSDAPAFARLRAFLDENVDLADSWRSVRAPLYSGSVAGA